MGEVKSIECRMRGLEKNIYYVCRIFDLYILLVRIFFLIINYYMYLIKFNCMWGDVKCDVLYIFLMVVIDNLIYKYCFNY